MSNYLAIATVTATLQRLLQASIQADVEGARVTTLRPENLGEGAPESGVNIFLYQILSSTAFGNSQMAGRQWRHEGGKKSLVALDLHYILSFYGDELELESQRLLGSTLRTLEDLGNLTPAILQDTIDNRAYPFLADSDLPEQSEAIRIERQDLDRDELSTLWSTFFDTAYLLSVAYKVNVVLVEGDIPARRALPVRDRHLGALPTGLKPVIEQVLCSAGRYSPILRDSTLLIRGRQLESPHTRIKLGSHLLEPQSLSSNQAVLDLGAIPVEHLRAGIQGLQVVYPRSQSRSVFTDRPTSPAAAERSRAAIATPPRPESELQWVESIVEPFVLRPTIGTISLEAVVGSEDDPRSGRMHLVFDLMVAASSRVIVALNERSRTDPAEYIFVAQPRDQDSNAIEVLLTGVRAGEYLIRATIDGAESLLQVDLDPQSPTYEEYIGPLLTVS
ncbi:MAG: DUF4255 domain-containing protein [Cyanobacteria bacterium P01_F01_bin.86]